MPFESLGSKIQFKDSAGYSTTIRRKRQLYPDVAEILVNAPFVIPVKTGIHNDLK